MQNQESDRYKIMLIELFRILLKIVFNGFMRVKVIDRDKLPKEGAVILTANHVGMLDMFMIGYRIPRLVHWMAKEELFKNKLLAKFITSLGAYPLKRGTRDTSATRTTFELLEQGEVVGIFSQGTRAKKGQPRPKAKPGVVKYAFETNTIIQPVAIWGNVRIFGKVYVKFGEPFYIPAPPEGTRYDKNAFAEMAQKVLDDIYGMMSVPGGENGNH